MKLAYSIATPDASGPLMSFWGDFQKNVDDIKSIGYEGLELFVRDPEKMEAPAVIAAIKQSGLSVAAVGTNPAMSQDGLTLLNPDRDVRDRAVARVLAMVDFASTWGAPVCIGKYRGSLWKDREKEAMKVLTDSVVHIGTAAAKKGVAIMIEPQNRNNVDNLNTVAETLEWIRGNDIPNTSILYDTFHGALAEISVAAGIVAAKDKLGFVHCSDSNRLPPGAGNINMADAFAVLSAVGYAGFVSMEIMQKPDSYTAAETSFRTVDYILRHVVK